MKIAALHLLAFGPFTDKTVVLDDGPANLHLVYGPNEAGKSSALRAMGELRFGIQVRSTDNFVHDYDRLTIGGSFIDAAGERVELVRSKGRNRTLHYMDPATRAADRDRTVASDHEAALTGGLGRSDFAAMFGLNHERLREGGKQLLRGDGELGSALFEASAGTRGTAALLETLDEDAKRLFNPRGNAKNAVLNDAGKQFDDARRSYRDALVKPSEWQSRKRAHDEASALLGALQASLDDERRRLVDLREMRVVEPLLRQFAASIAELDALKDVPLLSESAREQRLAAEPALQRAERDLADAAALVDACQRGLADIAVDESLLRHAAAVERLVKGVEVAARSGLEAAKLQVALDRIESDLQAGARRIAGKGAAPADVLAAVPSHPEQRALSAHFSAIDELTVRIRVFRQQTTEAADQLALAAEHRAESMPDAGLRATVLEALSRAQALGDVEQRLRDTDRQRRDLSMQLAQAISDLDMTVVLMDALGDSREDAGDAWASVSGPPTSGAALLPSGSARALGYRSDDIAVKLRVYRDARPLLSAEIEAVRAANGLRDELHRKVSVDLEALQREIEVQRRRIALLAAAGEVVTADMLGETRQQRDAMWARIRASFSGIEVDVDVERLPLVSAFEASQAEADRQADLLRADAQRAAVFEECRARIEQSLQRQSELGRQEKRLSLEDAAAAQSWAHQLRDAGVPGNLSPSALIEWQALRAGLLEKADRLGGLHADRDLMMAAISTAVHGLNDALEGISPEVAAELERPLGSMGAPVVVASDIATLGLLMRRAVDWEAAAVKQAAEHEARSTSLAAQRQSLARGRTAIAHAETELAHHRRAITDWLERAFVPLDSPPELCRARLAELLELQVLASDAAALDQRRREHAAAAEELLVQAAHVASLVGDPPPTAAALHDYADTVAERLRANQRAEQQRSTLLRDLDRGEADRQQAATAIARTRQTLRQLCDAARADDVDALPAIEESAARKRRATADLAARRSLLAQASPRPLAEIEQRLDGRDHVALDSAIDSCQRRVAGLEAQQAALRQGEQRARTELEAIDSSDQAAEWRERMEQAGARYRATVLPWARLKLAHALLQEALRRFRDRAQAPMVEAASRYFATMTGGLYTRLIATEDDDRPVLRAERAGGGRIAIDAMSEGTGDQLYLALRLAALELRRASHPDMPLVLDDVLVTSDDARAANILRALAEFSAGTQVLVFTHHRHVLEVGRAALGSDQLAVHEL